MNIFLRSIETAVLHYSATAAINQSWFNSTCSKKKKNSVKNSRSRKRPFSLSSITLRHNNPEEAYIKHAVTAQPFFIVCRVHRFPHIIIPIILAHLASMEGSL